MNSAVDIFKIASAAQATVGLAITIALGVITLRIQHQQVHPLTALVIAVSICSAMAALTGSTIKMGVGIRVNRIYYFRGQGKPCGG